MASYDVIFLGGGPAGLYFALLSRLRDPDGEVTLIERNAPSDTFGWGVVFSDQTLSGMQRADPKTAKQILLFWRDPPQRSSCRSIRTVAS